MDGWESFTFYYDRMTGWRRDGENGIWEILPLNGRPGFEVRLDDHFVGETFETVEAAKTWVDG